MGRSFEVLEIARSQDEANELMSANPGCSFLAKSDGGLIFLCAQHEDGMRELISGAAEAEEHIFPDELEDFANRRRQESLGPTAVSRLIECGPLLNAATAAQKLRRRRRLGKADR